MIISKKTKYSKWGAFEGGWRRVVCEDVLISSLWKNHSVHSSIRVHLQDRGSWDRSAPHWGKEPSPLPAECGQTERKPRHSLERGVGAHPPTQQMQVGNC